ncbi:MAG: hypothetical protein K6C30_00645, partial [Bacteroidaceae bacterium]|nr:hypothetical protein [Bacteroidaceae bacterium]
MLQFHNKTCRLVVLTFFLLTPLSVAAEQRWVDVTSSYFTNPSFTTSDKSDWQFRGQSDSFALIRVGCLEMWQGWMHMWRDLSLPNGHYRLSFQSLYRFRRHAWAYEQYVAGTDEHTAFYYANDSVREVPSEYEWCFEQAPGYSTYCPDGKHWYCNSMEA